MSSKSKSETTLLSRIFWTLCSLKLAVIVIFALAVALGAATILESLYDTPTAQFWVYRATWFHGLLGVLALNIFCVAISRYPWKIRHTPFLLAHLGILVLLAGSWITERAGLDGNLRVTEGETTSVVDLDSAALVISESDHIRTIPIPWIPPHFSFRPMDALDFGLPYDLKIDQFISHADASVSFLPEAPSAGNGGDGKDKNDQGPRSAIRIRMAGGPMGISEDIWLWEGAPGWKTLRAGPAILTLGDPHISNSSSPSVSSPSSHSLSQGQTQSNQTMMAFLPQKDGSLVYMARSSTGKKVRGTLKAGSISGSIIHPGWRGDVTVTVLEWIPRAEPLTTYHPSRVQYGNQAPPSAIHVMAQSTGVWLGLGDRAIVHFQGREVEIGYFPKRIVLPFSLRLERFTVEHDQGTLNPAAYSSRVSVLEATQQREATIEMNSPLKMGNYTIYQASYEDGDPRPVTSIFAVNQDPGRPWKYSGSLLIVLGSILLFTAKYRRKRKNIPSVLEASCTSSA